MNFKRKYMLRNRSLSALSWYCGFTSLLIAYGFIKWQKVKNYNDWMFENVRLDELDSISWLLDNYFRVGGYSILWCIPIAFLVDFILRQTIIKP